MFRKDPIELGMQLKKAISNEMFLEATMLENMILDSRVDYVLKEAGDNSIGYPLNGKIRKINMMYNSRNESVQGMLERDVINKLELWNEKKTRAVQTLSNSDYEPEKFRNIAIEGNVLVDYFTQKFGTTTRF
ncbi:MAG: hypothetical protein Q4D02_01270 [Clostridia bacterium]|nr:hypothetical protein [Clostridia bacterium]